MRPSALPAPLATPLQSPLAWAWALLLAVGYVLVQGYPMGQGDWLDKLPPVYHWQNPELYPHDWFMAHYRAGFNVRDHFNALLYALGTLLPLPAALFGLWLGVLVVSFRGLVALALAAYPQSGALAWVWPLFATLLTDHWTLGGNELMGRTPLPSDLAAVFAIWGVVGAWRARVVGPALLLGVATWWQPLVGLQAAALVGAGWLGLARWRALGGFGVAYALAAAPMLAPLLWDRLQQPPPADPLLFAQVFLDYRHPHHYLPSHFPLGHYARFGLVVAVGGLALLRWPPTRPRLLGWWLLALALGLGAGALAAQARWLPLTLLQPFKLTIWAKPLLLLGLLPLGTWLLARLGVPAWPAAHWPRRHHGWALGGLLLAACLGLGVVLASRHVPVQALQGRYRVGLWQPDDLTHMHRWMRTHLPNQAVVLSFPHDQQLAIVARRSTPAVFKTVVHEPGPMLDWYHQMAHYYGANLAAMRPGEGAFAMVQRTYATHWVDLRHHNPHGITHRLDDLTTFRHASRLGPVVHQVGPYMLTAVPRGLPQPQP